MKLTVVRSIPITFAVAVCCFLLSGIGRFKNAHHGPDYVIGETVWLGFLLAALATVVLTVVTLYRRRASGKAAATRA